MPQQFIYNGTDLGVSAIRLGRIPGWIGEAEEGAVGICGVPIDDPAGSLTITGWKSFVVNELSCPIGNQRVWTGFVNDRNYHRGESDSLRTGAARQIDTNLVDLNAIFSLRLFPQSDTTANRGSETDVARLAWLLSTSYLTTSAYGTVADLGLVSSSGPITLDAADYRGQSAMSLISDCMQASGKNCFPYYKESAGHIGVFYDFDYSAVFDSTLTLSNVLSDINNTTCFMYEEDANLNRDPSLVYSGVQVPFSGTGSPVYRTRAATASAFISRDTTAPNVNVKTSTAANALGDRYLASIATEDDLLTLTVKIPKEKVTLIREGMRIQVKASHLPDLTSFTYCRILSREAKQQEETPDYYQLVLKLAPPTPTPPVTSVGPFCFFLGSAGAGGSSKIQFSMSNPGDPTKRAYGYVTTGAAGATILGDEFTIASLGPPPYNFQCTADSTAGNGTGVDGSTLLAGLNSLDHGSVAGLFYSFTAGVPVTFNFYVTYQAAGGLGYTNGAELAVPSVWSGGVTSPVPIPGMVYSQGPGTPASVAPTGTLFIGSVTMTYNP